MADVVRLTRATTAAGVSAPGRAPFNAPAARSRGSRARSSAPTQSSPRYRWLIITDTPRSQDLAAWHSG